MCTFLLDRQVAIADFHHIHIIVREKVNRGQVVNVLAHDRLYVLPGRANVGTVSIPSEAGLLSQCYAPRIS